MTPAQLQRRKKLLERSDAALERWPDRKGRDFADTMNVVAEGLAALAAVADRDGADAVERARTWRQLGNAYFDLGVEGGGAKLEQAVAAFESAERLLDGADEPVEKMKLNYSFGQTLLQLSEARDLVRARQAHDRFATALGLARKYEWAAVAPAERALRDSGRVASLLEQAEGMSQRIDRLKAQLADAEPPPPAAKPQMGGAGGEIQALFGVLQQEFDKEKPNLEPTRRAGLQDFMGRLGQLVAGGGKEKTLEDMQAGRGKLESLMREIAAQGKKPSLKGPGAPPGSRSEKLLALLQDLKMFVWASGMKQDMPQGMRDAAIELFPRIGRLTTWISEAGADTEKVAQLEADQARGIAHEVRCYARREHLMLARPVWSRHAGLVEANRIFFSGPGSARESVAKAASMLGLETNRPVRTGSDFAEQRWQDLRAANVAILDLSDADPQVYYELGIALAIGAQLLLTAREGTDVPFNVAQSVSYYV